MRIHHLDPCPKCDGRVLMAIKIKEGTKIKESGLPEDPEGTLFFVCSRQPSHRFVQRPGCDLVEARELRAKEREEAQKFAPAKTPPETVKSKKAKKSAPKPPAAKAPAKPQEKAKKSAPKKTAKPVKKEASKKSAPARKVAPAAKAPPKKAPAPKAAPAKGKAASSKAKKK